MIPNRLVLDTNVCLDLFVFHDPRWATLHAALRAGTVEAVTRADCRTEWLLVLHYARFALTSHQRDDCAAEFDALIALLPGPESTGLGEQPPPVLAPLPRCSDVDDQKFLEAARDSQAATLLTKDKALLKLAGKCRRAGLFAIVRPDAWQPIAPAADAWKPLESKHCARPARSQTLSTTRS